MERRGLIRGMVQRLNRATPILVPVPCTAGIHAFGLSDARTGKALAMLPEFWMGAVALLAFAAWQLRERSRNRRESELTHAVRQRTEELERGRALEGTRNRILEMLVSNAPQSAVLEAIARLAAGQMSGSVCVVLMKPDGRQPAARDVNAFRVAAAPGVPETWLAAIDQPHGVPFEVWRRAAEFKEPGKDPAWRVFSQRLHAAAMVCPAMIQSIPIGDARTQLGAILMLYAVQPPAVQARPEQWHQVLQATVRLAQLAIEHGRFCEDLDFQAHHDALTGLPNRLLFEDRFETELMAARANAGRLALLYVDLDGFKQINDRFSHGTGDIVLTEISRRMGSVAGPRDIVARIGGDEFNILLPEVAGPPSVEDFAERLMEVVRQPVHVNGNELTVTISVGIAMFPDDGTEAADLLRQADAAMYCAKSLGKNRLQTFAENIHALDRVHIEQDLRHALRNGWFEVYYQPKISADGNLAGLEALIRMNHPDRGQVLPGLFIPVAEGTELIVPMGAWVITEVCRQLQEWGQRGFAPVVVAVNVSAVQISRPDFARSVESCLDAHGIPPSRLELEVIESMVINADSEAHRQMQLLRALGVFISIDDFGTGFSSLSYLHKLEIDAVKLDQSFVHPIVTDEAAQRLVRAVIAVARGLGLDVIAEGVETEGQRLELVAAGCPVMQGYLFARPGPPGKIEHLLKPKLIGGELARLYESLDTVSQPVDETIPA